MKASTPSIRESLLLSPQAIASIEQGSGDPGRERCDRIRDQSRKDRDQYGHDHKDDRRGEHDPRLDGFELPLAGDRRAYGVAEAKQAGGRAPGASSASRRRGSRVG